MKCCFHEATPPEHSLRMWRKSGLPPLARYTCFTDYQDSYRYVGGCWFNQHAASKDLILANTMQAIQHQMRTDRKSVKQTIIARMKCEASTYPVGFILSDLQAMPMLER